MVRFVWNLNRPLKRLWYLCNHKWLRLKITTLSLFYNHHLSHSYIADILMEPMFWFVDNFTKFLGPFFVIAVCGLTASVVVIAYIVGLPWWWRKSPGCTVLLLVVGHWLLWNIVFHYYMGCKVSPGLPPEGALIAEAVSMCKKCISPKPPRTHHCSICNTCILKMDHHCPWLNNCVGHYNHRYFFLYMVYMVLGVLFLIVFGLELAYEVVYLEPGPEVEGEIVGHPVNFNDSVMVSIMDESARRSTESEARRWQRTCIVYMALICSGVFIALGSLSLWHARLISRGETSIEGNINKSEAKRYALMDKAYVNPYNFGRGENWRLFLGLRQGRTWRHVLLPSGHQPLGDGLTWTTVLDREACLQH